MGCRPLDFRPEVYRTWAWFLALARSGRSSHRGDTPPDGGVREPRRPHPVAGAGAAALPSPTGSPEADTNFLYALFGDLRPSLLGASPKGHAPVLQIVGELDHGGGIEVGQVDIGTLNLVWQQGTRHPIEHRVDEDVRLESTRFSEFILPERFSISGFCDHGHAMHASCQTIEGVWTTLDLSRSRRKSRDAREHRRGVFREQ